MTTSKNRGCLFICIPSSRKEVSPPTLPTPCILSQVLSRGRAQQTHSSQISDEEASLARRSVVEPEAASWMWLKLIVLPDPLLGSGQPDR